MKTRTLAFALLAAIASAAAIPYVHSRPQPAAATSPAAPARPLSTAAEWTDEGWTNVTTEELSFARLGAGSDATHEFGATLVILENSGWTQPAIVQSLEQLAATYAQCGLRLGTAQLISARAPGGSPDISKARDTFLSQHTPVSALRPVVYFARASSDDPASYAYHRGHASDASRDTVWMLAAANSPEYRKRHTRTYSPLAHELLHVLTMEEHLPIGQEEDNLLGFYSDLRSDQINARQCQKARNHPGVVALK